MLGSIVTVTVDRPMGSYHPEHHALCYPINYGYVGGTCAADGEEIDAYIVGVDRPLKQYTGRVIAIIHRLNDVEDKLVVAPDGVLLDKEQITALTAFQEQYFDIDIEMIS